MDELQNAAAAASTTIEHLEAGWSAYTEKAHDVVSKLQFLTESLSRLAVVLPNPKADGPIADLRYSKERLIEEVDKMTSAGKTREAEYEKRRAELEQRWEQKESDFAREVETWKKSKDVRDLVHLGSAAKIKLDVGGKVFSVSLGTLLGVEGTFFSALFSDGWVSPPGADGTYFIDRDPFPYHIIFNYLREGDVAVEELYRTPGLRKAVCKEAEFLGIAELVEKVKEEPGRWRGGITIRCPHRSHNHTAYWSTDQGGYVCTNCSIVVSVAAGKSPLMLRQGMK